MMRTAIERVVAALLLLALSPLLLAISAGVRIRLGRPILFKQMRTGFRGEPFQLFKFRTMIDERDDGGEVLPDDRRITPLGRFLRRFSLDELPQLLNVLRGEVSFIGPRPLMHKYWVLDLYNREQARRFEVKPGLTGWGQVNGRNMLTWEEKFDLDVWYVDHRSIPLDLKILALTVSKVLHGRGISQNGHATAEEFTGSAAATGMEEATLHN